MAQIQAGVTYATGAQVTATNLNAHVNNAVLVPGAISDQTAASSTTSADSLLLLQGGVLKKATLAQIQAGVAPDAANYVQRDGSVAMTGELTLSSSTPVNALSAASKGYADTKQTALGFTPVNKAGDTNVGPIALAADPVSALQVATKQYVDTKQTALGFTPVNKAGDTGVGPIALTADPVSALQVTTKQYVDTQIATRVPTGGGTLTGTYLFSGKLQTSTAPTENNDVINKAYLDTFLDSIPQLAASAYFYTAAVGSSSVNTGTFLNVTATRSAGSTSLVVNYGGLAARYYDPVAPFFLTGQYVGLVAVTGVAGGLHKIISSDFNARTFTITQTATTAFSGSVQLSLVFDSTNLALGQYGFNTKSIYLDMTCVSKYYVNYIRDIVSGQSAFPAVSQDVLCSQVTGNANGYDQQGLMTWVMRNFGRTTYIYSQDVPEGFGSNSLGCHIGFFYNNSNGSDYSSLYAASFLVTAQLPPGVTP